MLPSRGAADVLTLKPRPAWQCEFLVWSQAGLGWRSRGSLSSAQLTITGESQNLQQSHLQMLPIKLTPLYLYSESVRKCFSPTMCHSVVT